MNDEPLDERTQIFCMENELQKQRGMLWVLGEIMKVANNIDSFNELMRLTTDMLMGVTGVNTCYIWVDDKGESLIYLRSTESNNKFYELKDVEVHQSLREVRQTKLYEAQEIKSLLIEGGKLPASRLVVPLMDFNDNSIIGGLVLEQEHADFFTASSTIFFETLGVFLSSNAKNSKLFEKVTKEAEKDPLTGVYNRRHLKQMIPDMIKDTGHVGVAVIDTDHFKTVNDCLGHLTGDKVLYAIADSAKNFFRPFGGKVVRYGGDEFVFLLPQPMNDTIELFSQFQSSVKQMDVIAQLSVPVSITMGICCYPAMTKDSDFLINAADRALLRGKEQGRDRVVIATKEECENKVS